MLFISVTFTTPAIDFNLYRLEFTTSAASE